MGAKIALHGNTAVIEGVEQGLHGATMTASDLRGGAGLAIAAMKINGESRVYNPHFIDRGYEDFEGMFSALGANIVRIKK